MTVNAIAPWGQDWYRPKITFGLIRRSMSTTALFVTTNLRSFDPIDCLPPDYIRSHANWLFSLEGR
ncbi:MAG TPA: hypothetical protein VGZ91_01270 [Candidatus Sulfotelmatobacter sp.]|nr:hypothetical protein [Candidatus Sulfotelmatobacter sp.]